jgi:hypothetical protein
LNDLKEEFPWYFKEESGNNTVKDSLGNLKENTKNEIDITKQVLKENDKSESSKREGSDLSEYDDRKKRPRNNEDN